MVRAPERGRAGRRVVIGDDRRDRGAGEERFAAKIESSSWPLAPPRPRSVRASSRSSKRSTPSRRRSTAGCPSSSRASSWWASPSVCSSASSSRRWRLWSVILWGVTGLLAGILAGMITMTRLSTTAMYKKIDGMPGATGHVLSSSLGRNWQASEAPIGVNPRTQEALYRAIGRGGVVLIGEGNRSRLTRLVGEERSRVLRVARAACRSPSSTSVTAKTRFPSRSSPRPSRRCRRRSTAPRWPPSSSASRRSRRGCRRCRSRRASTRRRCAHRARADSHEKGPRSAGAFLV